MRSLVEFPFHLSIRKIRQPDFPKLCPKHLVTITANRSSLTLQHLWNLAAHFSSIHLGFSHQKNSTGLKILFQRITCVTFHLGVSRLIKEIKFFCYSSVLGLHSQVLGWGGAGCRGGFCEKVLEAFPVSDSANASWLQDRPITGQSWAQGLW